MLILAGCTGVAGVIALVLAGRRFVRLQNFHRQRRTQAWQQRIVTTTSTGTAAAKGGPVPVRQGGGSSAQQRAPSSLSSSSAHSNSKDDLRSSEMKLLVQEPSYGAEAEAGHVGAPPCKPPPRESMQGEGCGGVSGSEQESALAQILAGTVPATTGEAGSGSSSSSGAVGGAGGDADKAKRVRSGSASGVLGMLASGGKDILLAATSSSSSRQPTVQQQQQQQQQQHHSRASLIECIAGLPANSTMPANSRVTDQDGDALAAVPSSPCVSVSALEISCEGLGVTLANGQALLQGITATLAGGRGVCASVRAARWYMRGRGLRGCVCALRGCVRVSE
jgi:hypothetical protein